MLRNSEQMNKSKGNVTLLRKYDFDESETFRPQTISSPSRFAPKTFPPWSFPP